MVTHGLNVLVHMAYAFVYGFSIFLEHKGSQKVFKLFLSTYN